MTQNDNHIKQLVDLFDQLLNSSSIPDIPEELKGIEKLSSIHATMVEIRSSLYDLSKDDISNPISARGFVAGCLKSVQANLRHLTWQVQHAIRDDASHQCVSNMDLRMVMQLNGTIKELQQKEKILLKLTKKQRQEAALRSVAMSALRQRVAKFKYLAEHDPFTECLNRRSFFSLAKNSLQNAVITKEPCAIALMDLDSFKALNDTYGHLNGDIALKHVVQVASSRLRSADLIGRYGGEEFIFFFSGVDLKQAATAAERIRHSIAESLVPLPDGETVNVTVSMGVSSVLPDWPGDRTSQYVRKVTEQADKALYRAKLEGKNRVCCAELAPPEGIPISEEV